MSLFDNIEMLVLENSVKQNMCDGISNLTIHNICAILNVKPMDVYNAVIYGDRRLFIYDCTINCSIENMVVFIK